MSSVYLEIRKSRGLKVRVLLKSLKRAEGGVTQILSAVGKNEWLLFLGYVV